MVDNLNIPADASVSEMEQALIAYEAKKADTKNAPEVEEPKEEEKVDIEQQVQEPKEPIEQTESTEEAPAESNDDATEEPQEYDYKKGYENLRVWNTKLAQDVAELKKVATAPAKEQPEQQITKEQWQEFYEKDPIEASKQLAQREAENKSKGLEAKVGEITQAINDIKAESTVNQFRKKYKDFAVLETDIATEVNSLPQEIINNPTYYNQVLETAYWSAKGRKSEILAAKAKANGVKEAQKKAQSKKEAYVEGSVKTETEQPFDLSKASIEEHMKYMESIGLVKDI